MTCSVKLEVYPFLTSYYILSIIVPSKILENGPYGSLIITEFLILRFPYKNTTF